MSHLSRYTAAEAAFVLREPVRAVRKALDAGPVRPFLLQRAGAAVRAIDWRDLLYLYAVRALREELTPKARMDLYEAVRQTPIDRDGEVRFGRLRVSVADLVDEVDRRTADLAALADRVDFRSDGEPLLKGTAIEVYRIAALLAAGMAVDDVALDYPSLSPDAIKTARSYAQAYPKAGRPYPGTTVKRALRGAGLDALDEAFGGG
ncbi:hypothetical protein STVA_29960 [Allostella vacuolata]|nr:hypothetical protein STVA_29960 [Stella vacuolata]